MIPKVIHYCWFGGKPLPEDAKANIKSWKKYCPEYELKEWNEDNFDINSNIYVKEAYETKKWAFVTDYVRLYAMVKEGGIYMDTDVEVTKNLDVFLNHQAFSGFETDIDIPTGIMACEKDFLLFSELLDDYKDRHFIIDGMPDLTANVYVITQKCVEHGLKRNNKFQLIDGFALYPKDYFCPKDHKTGLIYKTENTATIHHFAGSWVTGKERNWLEFTKKLRKLENRFINAILDSRLSDIIKKLYVRDLKTNIKIIKGKIIHNDKKK